MSCMTGDIDGYYAYGRDQLVVHVRSLSLIKRSIILHPVNGIVYKAFVSFAGCDCTTPRPIAAGNGLY